MRQARWKLAAGLAFCLLAPGVAQAETTLVEVESATPAMINRLEALGLDVTYESAARTEIMLHGAEDNVIPSVETVLLTNYLRDKTDVHAVLSGLITHAEVDRSAAAIEVWRLVGFWRSLMSR